MRALFVVENLGQNGHSLHALDIASALQDLSVDVRVISDRGITTLPASVLRDKLDRHKVMSSDRFTCASSRQTSRVLEQEGWIPDVVHCWSLNANLFSLRLAHRFGASHISTTCNGNRPRLLFLNAPISNNVTTITDEICRPLASSWWGPRSVVKITARMSTRGTSGRSSVEMARIRTAHCWPDADPIMLRVARFDLGYVDSVAVGIRLTQALRERGLPVRFVHVGPALPESPRPGFRRARDQIVRLCDEANATAGEIIAVSDTRAAPLGPDMPFAADIVVGGAKAAMEGLIAGRPTVVVANNDAGLQGLVNRATIDAFEQSNFSSAIGDAASADAVCDALEELLSSPAARDDYRDWAISMSRDRFLASAGARQHLAFYREAEATKIGRTHLVREEVNVLGRRLWESVLPILGALKRTLARQRA